MRYIESVENQDDKEFWDRVSRKDRAGFGLAFWTRAQRAPSFPPILQNRSAAALHERWRKKIIPAWVQLKQGTDFDDVVDSINRAHKHSPVCAEFFGYSPSPPCTHSLISLCCLSHHQRGPWLPPDRRTARRHPVWTTMPRVDLTPFHLNNTL